MKTPAELIRQCPHYPKKFQVVYDGGITPDLIVLICESCSNKPKFQKFIKNKQEISQNSQEV